MDSNWSERERAFLGIRHPPSATPREFASEKSLETYDEETFPWTPKNGYYTESELEDRCGCRSCETNCCGSCSCEGCWQCYQCWQCLDCFCQSGLGNASCDVCFGGCSICCEVLLGGLLNGLCGALFCGAF